MGNISLIILWIAKIIFALTVIHMTVTSITAYLHRGMTHKSLEYVDSWANFFKIWLWFACGMDSESQQEWIAVHRLHHAETDTENDPHNPAQKGPWRLFFGAYFFYRASIKSMHRNIMANGETEYKHYSKDIRQDSKVDRILNFLPTGSGLVLGLVLYCLLFGSFGVYVWIAQTLWMPVVAGGIINVLGHTVGHHIYDSGDTSKSLAPQKAGIFSWILVIILNWASGGEHLHNQHHFRSNSARMGDGKGLGFDIGYFWIRVIQKLGGVKKMNVCEF